MIVETKEGYLNHRNDGDDSHAFKENNEPQNKWSADNRSSLDNAYTIFVRLFRQDVYQFLTIIESNASHRTNIRTKNNQSLYLQH